MGIAVGEGRIEAADGEQIAHPGRAARRVGLDRVHVHRLGNDAGDLHARIERAVGILEDDLHPSPQCLQVLAPQARHVGAVIPDLAGRGTLQPQNATAGRGLAAAALAHQPKRLAAVDGEVNAVDSLHHADGARQGDPFGNREVHA
jgi:hypothetical protein